MKAGALRALSGPDASGQLGRREGLGDVVRGAVLERPRDGVVAAVDGDEDHGEVGPLRDPLHQLDAVGAGQQEVEEDDSRPLGADALARSRPPTYGTSSTSR